MRQVPIDGKRADWPRLIGQAINALITPKSTNYRPSPEPESPTAGLTYFDQDTLKLRTYDGTVWNDHW